VIHRPRPLHALLPALLALALLAGCTVPRPEGASPLRYRDSVFTAVDRTNDIQYGSAPARDGNPEALKLDLYQPTGDTIAKRPVLIWIHGGGFIQGDKASASGLATYFAKLGYVTASINYRLLSPGGCAGEREPPPGCDEAAIGAQHDAQAAVRWFRAHAAQYRIDPERIAVGGASAGADTSILVGTHSEDPGDSGNPGFSSRVAAAVSVSGGLPTNETITPDDAPTIFFHGTADQTVFPDWALQNSAALHNNGVVTVFEPFEGAGHGLLPEFRDTIFEQTDYFLYHLVIKGAGAS
jgi:acetyl esterase/lipase